MKKLIMKNKLFYEEIKIKCFMTNTLRLKEVFYKEVFLKVIYKDKEEVFYEELLH